MTSLVDKLPQELHACAAVVESHEHYLLCLHAVSFQNPIFSKSYMHDSFFFFFFYCLLPNAFLCCLHGRYVANNSHLI